MKYGGKVCTILNNVLQKVTMLLLTTYNILPEPPQRNEIHDLMNIHEQFMNIHELFLNGNHIWFMN